MSAKLSKAIKLTDIQKETVKRMRNGGFYISLRSGAFWGGGSGDTISRATIKFLKRKGIIDFFDKLTDLGRSIDIG